MKNSGYRSCLLWLVVWGCLCAQSCNSRKNSETPEMELPAWLTEERVTSQSESPDQPANDSSSAEFRLNLTPGDQFPLRKIVQQELVQGDVSGAPTRNFSQLELMMAITVLDKQMERTKLGVRYSRVKYMHDIADEHVEFDSAVPETSHFVGVQAYRDMVNDGFAFWIGTDNQIVEVEGLAEFVNRCLRNIPAEKRQDVVLGIEAGSGESGIANFVDNTIGLLPYGKRTSLGDSWERQQQIGRPVPMHISNTYTLKELTHGLAVIDIRGSISPSTNLNPAQGKNSVNVTVNGGSTLGSCTIFRETGLPKESRVDRIVEMTVVMDNSISFRQTKRVTTQVESFPSTNTKPEIAALPGSGTSPQAHSPTAR